MDYNRTIFGDCRDTMRQLAADGVRAQTCVTSPPYFGLRDYGHPGQIGLEATPAEYIAAIVEVFRGVREVLADDGTLWLNLGDSYAANRAYQVPSTNGGPKHSDSQSAGGKASTVPDGLKPKDLIGIPWRVAFALQADGWYLRQDIIWHKPNPMPESVTDRCTKSHEYMFLLSKSERYYWNREAMQEKAIGDPGGNIKPTKGADDPLMRTRTGLHAAQQRAREAGGFEKRNRRSVWTVPTRAYHGAHFAVFPPALIEPCILAGSRPGDVVIDPFHGSGTTGATAQRLGRRWIGCELNQDYEQLQHERTAQGALVL